MISEKYNLSLFLLLPLVTTEDKTYIDYIGDELDSLENGYSSDINLPYLDNEVFLLFNPNKMKSIPVRKLEFNGFRLEKDVRINGNFYIKYALSIDNAYLNEKELIMDNKYFELSNEIKSKIMKFWNANANTKLYDALYVKAIEPIDIKNEITKEEDYLEQRYILGFDPY